jgi:CheY-like chemotaxis protein
MCSAALKSVFESCNRIQGEGNTQKFMIARTAPRSRIVIIEEVQETRDLIKELLKRDGHNVDAVRDEDEAVDRIQRNHPDLILISLEGALEQLIATAQRIRGRGGLTRQTPIVIFSLEAVPEGVEEELGENIRVTAPDNFNQLRALLMRVLRVASRTH